jgi:general secretion pathway protein A
MALSTPWHIRLALSLAALFCFTLTAIPARALTTAELEKQAQLLSDFLVAGRGVVAQSIPKYGINDAAKGDKGFTPAMFVQDINAKFLAATGIDLQAGTSAEPLPGNTLALLQDLLDISRQVCAENQELINMPGIGFKGFIPATYGKMVGEMFKTRSGIDIKQTSLHNRNAYNAPDTFENEMLTKMEAAGWPRNQVATQAADGSFRLVRPLYVENACLSCHGDPVGELDVAGRKKEGYREGDLRGAISVKIPAR